MSRIVSFLNSRLQDASISQSARTIFIYQFFTVLIGLASSIIIARVLGPENKGLVDIFVLTYSLAMQLGVLGFEVGLLYQITQKDRSLSQAHGTGLMFAVIAGVAIGLLGWLSMPLLKNVFPNIPEWIILAAFLLSPFVLYKQIWEKIMIGTNRTVVIHQIANIFSVIHFAAIITLLLFGLFSYETIIYWSTFRIAVDMGTSFFLIRAKEKKVEPNFGLAKKALGYGWIIYIGAIANVLHFKIDQVMISAWLGPEAVGMYTVSVRWAEMLFLLDTAILSAALYKISSSASSISFEIAQKVFRTQITISTAAGFLLALLAYPMILLLYGEAYTGASLPLILLIPGIIFWSSSKSISNYLTFNLGFGAYLTKVSILGFLLNIFLNFYFIKYLNTGINGAAIASSISYLIVVILVKIKSHYQRNKNVTNQTSD
jgi:O-antigen/teichoic acid export membrane protein